MVVGHHGNLYFASGYFMTSSTVHVVHCIDTEGPLYESLNATFERIKNIFDIEIEPSRENLKLLQKGKIPLDGMEDKVANVISPDLLKYNETWDQINEMLDELMSDKFRNQFQDSFGNGWIYNWHCMDHVGFETNPRRRDIGYHNIHDHYAGYIRETDSIQDGLHFHHHPIPFSKAAHHPATHYFSHTPLIFQSLARRILERQWFPCVYRPGFHTTRPDSHWLLEQFIPFEYANQAMDEKDTGFLDQGNGRFGDWRNAPKNWRPYHPHHDDYQKPGDCRRLIARSLNVGTRHRLLQEEDVEQAFYEAEQGLPVVLSFNNHDFRDMRPDVLRVQELLKVVSSRHPSTKFRYCEAREAMRSALDLPEQDPIKFEIELEKGRLSIKTQLPTFGPQPFFAIQTKDNRFFHDNLDFQKPFYEWSYMFDELTYPIEALFRIGIGTCDAVGNVTVAIINLEDDSFSQVFY